MIVHQPQILATANPDIIKAIDIAIIVFCVMAWADLRGPR